MLDAIGEIVTTRYSKRKPDGIFEHYDTREAMEAADVREHIPLFSFSLFFAFFGFMAGGVAALIILSQFNTWPTFIRFLAVLGAATAVGYIIGKLGKRYSICGLL